MLYKDPFSPFGLLLVVLASSFTRRVFPQWNIVSCLLGRRFPAVTAVFLADSNSGRKEDVEREWIECWIHISTPLPHLCVSLTYSTLGIPRYHTLHLADPVTKRIKMCNKTSLIYSIYTQQVGRNTSNMIPGHIWSHEGVSLFLFWVDGQAGGFLPLDFKWRMLAVWCYKSKMGLSSKGGKDGEAQIRPQLEIISAHLSLADKPPHCTSKTYSRRCLMLGSARVCKRKHFFFFSKYSHTDTDTLKACARTLENQHW